MSDKLRLLRNSVTEGTFSFIFKVRSVVFAGKLFPFPLVSHQGYFHALWFGAATDQ